MVILEADTIQQEEIKEKKGNGGIFQKIIRNQRHTEGMGDISVWTLFYKRNLKRETKSLLMSCQIKKLFKSQDR